MDPKKPDPEMLKELDFLLNMDALEEENDWDDLAQVDVEAIEKDHSDDDSEEGGN